MPALGGYGGSLVGAILDRNGGGYAHKAAHLVIADDICRGGGILNHGGGGADHVAKETANIQRAAGNITRVFKVRGIDRSGFIIVITDDTAYVICCTGDRAAIFKRGKRGCNRRAAQAIIANNTANVAIT